MGTYIFVCKRERDRDRDRETESRNRDLYHSPIIHCTYIGECVREKERERETLDTRTHRHRLRKRNREWNKIKKEMYITYAFSKHILH